MERKTIYLIWDSYGGEHLGCDILGRRPTKCLQDNGNNCQY